MDLDLVLTRIVPGKGVLVKRRQIIQSHRTIFGEVFGGVFRSLAVLLQFVMCLLLPFLTYPTLELTTAVRLRQAARVLLPHDGHAPLTPSGLVFSLFAGNSSSLQRTRCAAVAGTEMTYR